MSKDNLFIVNVILSIRNSIRFLISKWVLILFFSFFGGCIGVYYAWIKKPVYTAEIIFSSEASGDNALGGYAGLAAQFGFDLGGGGGGAFEGDNLIELLRSQSMVEKTLLSTATFNNKKLFIDSYVENHQINKGWQSNPKFKNVVFEKEARFPSRVRDSILLAVTKGIRDDQLSVNKLDKKLNYIVVTMKDLDEVFAKDFLETLMDNASNFYVSYKSKKAKKNFDLINKMTDSVKGLLYGNIERYAVNNDLNVNPLRQQLKTGGQKIQVNAQANTALYTELLKQLGLSQITLQRETPLIQIIDQPMFPLKKQKPGRLFTGIIFAFAAGFLACIILLANRLIKSELLIAKQIE